MKTIRDIEHIEGVRVLVRVDFNVPIANGKVADDFRIRMAFPTIDFLHKKGAKVILVSHLESTDHDNPTLEPVAKHLQQLGVPVVFVKEYKKAAEIIEHIKNGDCVLLENLRFFDGEKDNDPKFAAELASLADIYVNDAFPVSHREHASIVGLPKLIPGYAGLQLEKEILNLSKVFSPSHPFLFILGGAKFETKLPLLEKFMSIADIVFVGGALATDFYKEKGYEVGKSRVSEDGFHLERFMSDPKLIIPVDVLNQKNETRAADGLKPDDIVMDDGPKTMGMLRDQIQKANFILWNGPLGMYEGGYRGATLELARLVAERTSHKGVESIVGGGDTLAAIAQLGIEDKFTFISTGGGAMLDFLAKGTLPGIEALDASGD